MVGKIIAEADLTSSTGTASRVDITFNIKGPVDKIDLDNNRLVVAGQNVIINLLTVFENGRPETLKLGDRLEISGLSDTLGGAVYAGYIRLLPPTTEKVEITGITRSINTIKQTFKIGDQLIDYSQTGIEPVESSFVRVTGTRTPELIIIAEQIDDLIAAPSGRENDILILDGIAESGLRTDALQQQSFTLSGMTVYIINNNRPDDTVFVNGTAADIGADTRLKVIGQFASPGILNAERIEFYVPPNVTAVGNIEAVNLAAKQISIAGLLVDIDNATQMLDASSAALQKFSIDDLDVGDQITAYIVKTDTRVSALFLRRDNIADESILATGSITLQGYANTPVAPVFNVGAITVDTSYTQDFYNATRSPISAADFFNAVSGRSLVNVQGRWQNTQLTASRVQFINLGNLTIVSTLDGSTLAGGNDFFSVWDGSFNTEEDVANGTSRENMFIANRQLVLGAEWRAHHVRVFGPGTYAFDACENNLPQTPPTPCETIEMTVGEKQIGVHMLVDWGNEVNIDVVNVWNRNQAFCTAETTPCSLYWLITNPDWDLASTDADGDGISGITLKDSNFANDITVNFNLNF